MLVSQTILTIDRTIRELLSAMANRLTFRDNFLAKVLIIPDSGPADTDFVVDHNLGVIPTGYIATLDVPGQVYGQDRILWTELGMTIRCSASNTYIVLVVF